MRKTGVARALCRAGVAVFALAVVPEAAALDAVAAEALAKKSGCLKCHSVTQTKDAPSYKEIAAKYKGKPDAQKALVAFVTTNPKVKADGKEELHDALKTKNEAEIKNVVEWILSR